MIRDTTQRGDVVLVSLDQSPEEMAEALIADTLPPKFLYEFDVSTRAGQEELGGAILTRHLFATLERDELIEFVKRNAVAIRAGGLNWLKDLRRKLDGQPELSTPTKHLDEALTNIEHIVSGHPERVDLVSSRLLWLLNAIWHKVSADKMSYDEALQCVKKPEHVQRIAPRALEYLLSDYVYANVEPRIEYLMLIGDCARLIGDAEAAAGAMLIVGALEPPLDRAALRRWVQRVGELVSQAGPNRREGALRATRKLSRLLGEPAVDDGDF